MVTLTQKNKLFIVIIVIGIIIGIAFSVNKNKKKKKKNSKKKKKNSKKKKKNSKKKNSTGITNPSSNGITNSNGLILLNNSTNSLSNNSSYTPTLNNTSSTSSISTTNSNTPDLKTGTALICPPNTQQGGLFCYDKCKSNEQWDGTHTCYTNPKNWAGGQTLTHLQHKSYASQAGTENIIPSRCTGGKEFHQGWCYDAPDKSKFVFSSLGLYRTKCDSGYGWNGTKCAQGAIRTGMTLYGWIPGDSWLNLDDSGNRCRADNRALGCKLDIALWHGNCPKGQRWDGSSCWRDANLTGGLKQVTATLPDACWNDKERRGRLCYKKCLPGYERRNDNIDWCQTKCPDEFTYIGIGGCQKPSRMISNKGSIGSVGVCPTTHPIRKGSVCYKKI